MGTVLALAPPRTGPLWLDWLVSCIRLVPIAAIAIHADHLASVDAILSPWSGFPSHPLNREYFRIPVVFPDTGSSHVSVLSHVSVCYPYRPYRPSHICLGHSPMEWVPESFPESRFFSHYGGFSNVFAALLP
ncbi:hypothetical protein B0H11DRAFT_1975411 [Mycena galericulata]|nr:hypothetical protein B0H11DRAFT_1975411 [Mycena galericulata]